MRTLLGLVLFALTNFNLKGQSMHTLSGVILDDKTEQVIAYANIFLLNHQEVGSLSSTDGSY